MTTPDSSSSGDSAGASSRFPDLDFLNSLAGSGIHALPSEPGRFYGVLSMYGKATETAIAAMSRLAEVYDGGTTRLSAAALADDRGLQRPFVGKVLTILAQAGLVEGTRGPGGGFALAKHPKRIKVYDVFKLFEREDKSDRCPFGGGICGVGDKCALHDKLVAVQNAMNVVLRETTFEEFRVAYQEGGLRPASRGRRSGPRESFRAPVTGKPRKKKE